MFLYFFLAIIPLYLLIFSQQLIKYFRKKGPSFKVIFLSVVVLLFTIPSAISYSSNVMSAVQLNSNTVSTGVDAVVPIAQDMRTTVYELFSNNTSVGIAALTKIPYLPLYEKEFVLLDKHEEPFAFSSTSYSQYVYRFALDGNSLTSYPLHNNLRFYFYIFLVLFGVFILFLEKLHKIYVSKM